MDITSIWPLEISEGIYIAYGFGIAVLVGLIFMTFLSSFVALKLVVDES